MGEIDFEKEYIEIASEKMKGEDISEKFDFVYPLPKQAIEILKKMMLYSKHKSKYVFPSQITNLKCISENTVNQALQRLGYKGVHCHHSFRSTFSTNCYELFNERFTGNIIKSCLAHKESNQVRSAYNRYNKFKYLEQKKEAHSNLCRLVR